MAHLHTTTTTTSRSRPEPLHLHQSNNQQHSERARLLSSLRSAPLVPHQSQSQPTYQQQQQQTQYAIQQQQQQGMDPRSAAYYEFQQAQTAYLQELQRQILVKQNEIWINQQQMQAEAALRQMSLQNEAAAEREREREREWNAGMERELEREREREEFEQARSNPLVASALARRKRQSLNLEAQQRTTIFNHERQTTPPSSHSPPASHHSSSSNRSTPPPPAVILSAPGEPYPDTSSASGSESGETRPSTPSTTNSSPRLQLEQQHQQDHEELERLDQVRNEMSLLDKEMKSSRRRSSHLDTLSTVLGNRQKRRPVSMGGSPLAPINSGGGGGGMLDLNTPRPNQISFPIFPRTNASPRSPRLPSNVQTTPRSVSDSHSHYLFQRSPVSSPSSQQIDNPYVSVKPPTLPGHAFAVRQPKGPPTNLGTVETESTHGGGGEEINFGVRIRQKAIENLRGGLRSRISTGGIAGVDLAH
ncbi:hypothetical protein JCM3765_001965 [Sporobolomyces pararoseus]